jgi:hypothetical protein
MVFRLKTNLVKGRMMSKGLSRRGAIAGWTGIVVLSLAGFLFPAVALGGDRNARRPNIVFVLADDKY